MADHIKLELDGSGKLVDPGTTKRDNFLARKVIWEIKDQRIISFRIEGKTSDGYYPFKTQPNPNFSTKEDLTVEFLAPGEGVWQYKIIWKDSTGEHTLDPKIAVNPLALTEVMIYSVIALTLGLLATRFFR